MIEIYAGGNTCYESTMEINMLYEIMMDNFIKPDTMIKFELSGGEYAYIKKQSITSFNNISTTV